MLLTGTVVDRVTELKVHNIILDTKLSFANHLRSITASASSKLGIRRNMLYACLRIQS